MDNQRTEGIYIIPPAPGAVPSGDYVEFVHAVPEYPQVSRKLLQIHAAVAEVLHMIGAADAVESILRDLDNIQVLSEDGADVQLLSHRLQLIAA
jgi:hypothetical protein